VVPEHLPSQSGNRVGIYQINYLLGGLTGRLVFLKYYNLVSSDFYRSGDSG